MFSAWAISFHSCLSVQSTQALMMVGAWSRLRYIKDNDVKAATILPEVEGGEEELEEDWGTIQFD
jgi:hypothetical protein